MNGNASKKPFAGITFLARARTTFRNFFSEEDSPFNLAIFRIVLFSWMICNFNREHVLWFSGLPREIMFPPVGSKAMLSVLPVNPQWAAAASTLFIIFCFLALVGCFARTSALLAGLLEIYIRGISQSFGRVSHDHHLLWFMLILGASPCADVLSVDAIRLAFRQADRRETSKIEKSVAYAMPLRFVMLLLGLVYFFPGFWKFVTAPLSWAWSDNLRNQLYAKWFELGGWTPAFRIDHYPLLCKLSGVATIGFEMSFIFLILSPAGRPVALISGLIFHNLTRIFMHIGFLGLQICYVALVDWSKVFARTGRWLFREPLRVLYDGNCKLCRRTIATLQKFDVFGRIVYVNALDAEAVSAVRVDWIPSADLIRDMHAVIGKTKWVGFAAYRKLALRIPVFWLIWPLLWIPPVPWFGKLVYRRVADSRTCEVPKPVSESLAAPGVAVGRFRFLKTVGCALLIGNLTFGILRIMAGWPLVCYPTFSSLIRAPTKVAIVSYGVAGEREVAVDFDVFRQHMPPARFTGLIRGILGLKDKTQREKKLKALVTVISAQGIDLSGYSAIRFYRAIYSTEPEQAGKPCLSKTLEAEVPLGRDFAAPGVQTSLVNPR
jgi:predicted DCC family thiol-disulfide oxidoreductase YuxK